MTLAAHFFSRVGGHTRTAGEPSSLDAWRPSRARKACEATGRNPVSNSPRVRHRLQGRGQFAPPGGRDVHGVLDGLRPVCITGNVTSPVGSVGVLNWAPDLLVAREENRYRLSLGQATVPESRACQFDTRAPCAPVTVSV